MKFLESDKIRLRAVEPADAGMMWEVENDSSQWLENGMAAPFSRRNLEVYADSYDADPIRAGQIRFVCETIGTRRPAGLADLYDISAVNRTAFAGIYILPPFRRKGHASEALALMENYARLLLNLRVLAAKVAGSNHESISLFEHAGYTLRGELPGWLMSGGETTPLCIFTKVLT